MRHCDALIVPGWCIPVIPAATVLSDHAVVINEGRIVDLLPYSRARAEYQPSVTIERPGHVLIPGLVNAHTHAPMCLFRGCADDRSLESWLQSSIWPIEKRWLSAEMVRDGAELAIAEMLSAGTTCFSDQYFFPEIVAVTAVDLQIRAVIGTPVIDFPTAWASGAAECLSKGSALVHDAYAGHPLVSTCFAPHGTNSLTDETFIELRVLADQLDIPVQIHLHETRTEIEQALKQTGMRPLQRLTELGLVNSSLLAVHCVHMESAELEQFVNAGVSIAHCPKSNLKLASGIAPITAYRAAGVNVAIGTDGAASNNVLDMLSELRMAALLAKVESGDAAALSAEQALRMATIDGAAALGLSDEIGSIEVGKWADLACVDLKRLHSQPLYDPISQLVYTAGADQVTDVWVAGKHQLDRGQLTGINRADLFERTAEWQQRISQSLT